MWVHDSLLSFVPTLLSVKNSGAACHGEATATLRFSLIASAGALSGLRTCMLANMDVELKVGDQSMCELGHFLSSIL